MKMLFVMRGAPGSGKSTFIEKAGLTPYTICPDSIRLLFEGPVMDPKTGKLGISQKNDKEVWKLALELLEKRMEKGELIVFDSTNSKSQEFCKYKDLLKKYRYHGYCIDFSDVPLETCLMQNEGRLKTSTPWKYVPENVIKNIYSRLSTQAVPSYFTKIPHDVEVVKKLIKIEPKNVDKYEKVVVFGDIHGCYNPLEKYFSEHPFSEKNLYVFTGDYIDRGLENDKVVEWLLGHFKLENVILLTGNHEHWLKSYSEGEFDLELANGEPKLCRSKEFFYNTVPQLVKFNKKDLRDLCRKFSQLFYCEFDGRRYIITHGGFGHMPENLGVIASDSFIKPRKYEEPIDEWFNENHKDENLWQVHGHRNLLGIDAMKYPHSINLCHEVEFGKELRILEITKD